MKLSSCFVALLTLINVNIFSQNIDWSWAIKTGGGNYDVSTAVTTDIFGSIYITGNFFSSSNIGGVNLNSGGTASNAYVAKLDSSGNWEWAVQAHGFNSSGGGIVTDSAGNVYVSGVFLNIAVFGTDTLIANTQALFIAKLDASGNWQWAVKAEGSFPEKSQPLTIDDSGNLYVAGSFNTDFGPTATFGSTVLTPSGQNDIFIAKLNPAGNWEWAVKAGGTSEDNAFSMFTDAAGKSYLCGVFTGSATFGSTTLTSGGDTDVWVAKVDESGDFVWTVKAGGTGEDNAIELTGTTPGSLYICGTIEGAVSFGTIQLTSAGLKDAYAAKLDTNGNWTWVTPAGQTGPGATAVSISTDQLGNNYVLGYFSPTLTFGNDTLNSSVTSGINYNSFVAAITEGGSWIWGMQYGFTTSNIGAYVLADNFGNVYVNGDFENKAEFGNFILTNSFNADIYFAKFKTPEQFTSAPALHELFPAEKINAYPNPFENKLSIQGLNKGEGIIKIYNLKGQTIYTEQINTDSSYKSIRINNHTWEKGIYFMEYQTSTDIQRIKLIKQ